jgi:hypothetical protein
MCGNVTDGASAPSEEGTGKVAVPRMHPSRLFAESSAETMGAVPMHIRRGRSSPGPRVCKSRRTECTHSGDGAGAMVWPDRASCIWDREVCGPGRA